MAQGVRHSLSDLRILERSPDLSKGCEPLAARNSRQFQEVCFHFLSLRTRGLKKTEGLITRGVSNHFCDTCGNLPLKIMGGVVFGIFFVVSQKWIPFPTALVQTTRCLEALRLEKSGVRINREKVAGRLG